MIGNNAHRHLRTPWWRGGRRLGGSGFLAVTMVLVPTQCQPAASSPAASPATSVVASQSGPPRDTPPASEPVAATSAPTTTSAPAARECAGAPLTPGTNLLVDPSFEVGAPAGAWIDESTTVGPPIYSISTTHGVVDGMQAKAFTYVGQPDDDGTGKAQFYQAPIRGVSAGQQVRFSICVTAAGTGPASMVRSYAAVGVEAFAPGGGYLSDVATYITAVSSTPTRYAIDYVVPAGTDYLAVYIQSPEVYATSVFDLVFDQASLVVIG
jgi:hypothetical protein